MAGQEEVARPSGIKRPLPLRSNEGQEWKISGAGRRAAGDEGGVRVRTHTRKEADINIKLIIYNRSTFDS